VAGEAQPGRGPETVRWKNREHEGLAAGLFLLPNLIGFLIFTAIPVGAAFVLAFYDYDLLLGASWAGLENFRELFTIDRVFRAALFNTVYFTAVSVPLSVHLPVALCHGDRSALAGLEVALPARHRVD
jgi:ABC-type sugar transport system permease subunit